MGDRFDFAHDRVREVAFAQVQAWRRPRLHRRIAETIEALHADRLPDFWEALADHWERGEAWARAAHYHLSVAERAKRRYAYATAEISCRKAAEAAAKSRRRRAPSGRGRSSCWATSASLRGDLDRANESYEASLAGRDGRDRTGGGSPTSSTGRRPITSRTAPRSPSTSTAAARRRCSSRTRIIYGLEILQPVLEQLCQEFRIVTMDLRGTGRSDPIPGGLHAPPTMPPTSAP